MKKKNVLIVAAHSDDEALGCGGTIAKHVATDDEMYVIFLTDGVGSRAENSPEVSDQAIKRNTASIKALAALGVPERNITSFSFPDNAMDSLPRLKIVKALEKVISEIQPEIVYTHHGGDLNVDHRYAYEATMTACRPQPGFCVKEIYSFEVPSSTAWAGTSYGHTFIPMRYVNIENHFDQKVKSLEAYSDEMREFPHARSIQAVEALAKYRGSQVGVKAAEAFAIERIIET